MSSHDGRSNSFKLASQRTQQSDKKQQLKRIRIGENPIFNSSANFINRPSLSLIQANSTSNTHISKGDTCNSPNSIVQLDYFIKPGPVDQVKNTQQGTQNKGQVQYYNIKDPFEKLELNGLHSEQLFSQLPPIKDQSKFQIESNSNLISQLVQGNKKMNITSLGTIPFNNMSPQGERIGHHNQLGSQNKLQTFAPESIHQLYQSNIRGSYSGISSEIQQQQQQLQQQQQQTKITNQFPGQNLFVNQIHNVTSIQSQGLVNNRLLSLQGLCSPNTLQQKKKRRDDTLEGKVDSGATPSSFSSRPDDPASIIRQSSEQVLKLIKSDSPAKIQQQNSFFAKNSFFNNSNFMNKTASKDSQTYSSVEKNSNGFQKSNSDRKRNTLQEFFTKRLTQNILQKSLQSSQNYDYHSNNPSQVAKKIPASTTSLLNKSTSITQFSKLEDISKILQMQVTSAFSDVPRNRADLKDMIKWFEKMKKQNEEENVYNIEEKRKKQQELIQVCFKELSHQIRIDFLERDQFFKMIWNENVNYYKSFIEDFESIRLKINTAADSEYNRVSDFYKQYIKTKDLACEEAFLEKRNAEKKLEELKEDLHSNQQIQNVLKDEVNRFKKICMFLKKKLVTLTKEMEGVTQRQQDRAVRNKQNQINDFYKEQLSKLKQQGSEISQQNEQTIQSLIEQLKLANESMMNQQNQQQYIQVVDENVHQLERKNTLDDDEDDQDGDDDNFTFEYNDGGDLVQGVDQLNAVIVNTEQEVKKECKDTEVDDELRKMYMKDLAVQTDLYLVDTKYDVLMYDVETMNDIFDFYTYKQQMDEQVDKFDANQFMNALGEQEQQENQNFVNTITQLRMNSIEESGSSSSSGSDSDSDSKSSQSSKSDTEKKKKKEKNAIKIKEPQQKKSVILHPALAFLNVKKDYDHIRGFQQRQSIRQRLSIRPNIFNSNRHLGLYLEQYLSNHFINDIVNIFAEKIAPGISGGESTLNLPTSSTNINLDIPQQSSLLEVPRTVGAPRKSILNSIDTNPFIQKKRSELKQKLTQLLEPEKLKSVLDDAGLKVTSSQTESKLEKFVKIYQMSQLKGQELQVQLTGAKNMLEKYQDELTENSKLLSDKDQLTEEQKAEILRLEQIIREMQAEIELRIQKEKEAYAKLGTLSQIENEESQTQHLIKSKQPRIFKQRREKKEFTGFQLGKKINMEWEFQKQQNSGKQIVEKAKNKKMAKFHNFMTVKTILKQITMLYNERLNITKENSNYKDIEFSNFTYNFYSAQYGVKKIADQKFLILILSIKKYSQIFRINLFAKFLGLQDGNTNYSTEELNKYIDVLDFINNISQAGTNYVNNDSEQKYLVSYIKAVHYISQFGDTRMKPEENQELRRDVEAMKFIDANKVAVVDFDLFMNRLLTTYKILINRAKQYVINAFNACDLDGNRKCNFDEWSMLNRHIEPDKFDDDQIVQIFEDNADIIEEDGEKNLSFDKFAIVSLEYELFSDVAQDRYLEISNPLQFRIKYDALIEAWPLKMIEIQQRFYRLDNIDQDTKDDWLNITDVLNDKLNTVVFSNSTVKPLLIAYNILEKESILLEADNVEYLKANKNNNNNNNNNPSSSVQKSFQVSEVQSPV